MEKAYNLSLLFEEGEFDAQKGYHRHGSKEVYFSVLYRFTLDSGKLLEMCRPEQFDSGAIDTKTLETCAVRLHGLLANIGAINLAWSIQRLNPLLEKGNYFEFRRQFREVLIQVDKLRRRIISAEKADGDSPKTQDSSQKDRGKEVADGTKYSKILRRENFERLLMLIDNFELESAAKTASSLMRHSYAPDIDETLEDTYKALEEFDFTKSLEEAKKLLKLVTDTQGTEKSDRKTILAVDDMPSVLTTLEAMLKDRYNVYPMTNYDSAVKFLCSNTADLILLDIEMPGIDGFAMMQLFRGLPEYAKTPIIILTGSVSDEHIKMAVSLGARDFIKKPVDLTVLRNKLENALSQS